MSGAHRVDVVGRPSNVTAARLLAELRRRGHLVAFVEPGRLAVEVGPAVAVAPYDRRPLPTSW
jgi:hypothetical protein